MISGRDFKYKRMQRNLILYILLFVISGTCFSQNAGYPDGYKLSGKKHNYYDNIRTDNIKVTVNPVRSKYPISNFITDIFVTGSGDTVWFATGSGLMRTSDRFGTFDNYLGLDPFGNDDISGFTINNNVLAVATAISEEISGENVPTGTGIKVSTDFGLNWSSYGQPLDGMNDTVIIYGSNSLYALPVVVRQQNLSYDITVTKTKNDPLNYTIWITSFAGGLRKSTDYGNTWQRVLLPPDNLDSIHISGTGYNFALDPRANLNHRVFTVEALNDSVIIAGTANGINISRDWGVSWRKYSAQNSGSGTSRVSGNFVVNLHVQRYGGKSIIWGATRRAEGQDEVNAISYSTNGGYSWAYTLSDYSPNNISSKDSIVYAETDNGLWRAYFGVFDWAKPSLIYDPVTKDIARTSSFYSGNYINDTLYIGSSDGLLRTKETGVPWASPWKIYRAVKEIDLNSDIKTYAAPNPFAPNTEVTRIYYKTGKPLSKITIKIFDFGMNPVRTVIQNATRTSPDELFTIWDGKNNDGYQVANGVYFYRIEVDDDDNVWGKILVMQ